MLFRSVVSAAVAASSALTVETVATVTEAWETADSFILFNFFLSVLLLMILSPFLFSFGTYYYITCLLRSQKTFGIFSVTGEKTEKRSHSREQTTRRSTALSYSGSHG